MSLVVVAENANRPGALSGQSHDRIDRRRFSGAIGSEEAVELPDADSQRDSVDRLKSAVLLHEAIDLYGRRAEPYGIKFFSPLYRWRRRVAMSSALSGIPQSANWVATRFVSKGTRRCFTSQPLPRSVKIA